METNAIRERLADENPDALYANGFDDALVGVSHRCGQPSLAVYDIDLCLEVLIKQGMSSSDAEDCFWYNTAGAWVGPHTPLFVQLNLE